MSSLPQIPLVDYRNLHTDRDLFMRSMEHALCDIGFMMLVNVPGLEAVFQNRVFDAAHVFFDLPQSVKNCYLMEISPQFRGYSQAGRTEDYHFGPDGVEECVEAPLWKRMQRGPNVWPESAPELRGAISALHARFGALAHELGHLICELLDVPTESYDRYFEDGTYIASMKAKPAASEYSDAEREDLTRELMPLKGGDAHIDGAPFITLLIANEPGLEVLLDNDTTWVDAPLIPGSIVVNIGATLSKLSGGKMVATTHRVNLLKNERRRLSFPFFPMPRFDVDLVPFDGSYLPPKDRALDFTYDMMKMAPGTRRRWYAKEWPVTKELFQKAFQARKARKASEASKL